jgi:hypothetical protein
VQEGVLPVEKAPVEAVQALATCHSLLMLEAGLYLIMSVRAGRGTACGEGSCRGCSSSGYLSQPRYVGGWPLYYYLIMSLCAGKGTSCRGCSSSGYLSQPRYVGGWPLYYI